MILHNKIDAQLESWRTRVTKLLKENGDKVAGEVTISQIYGGMRSVKSLVTDISFVDPTVGIRYRGHTLPVVLEKLPKPEGAEIPYVGGLYYLLMVGEFPTEEQALEVEAEWQKTAPFQIMFLRFCVACPTIHTPWHFSLKPFWGFR